MEKRITPPYLRGALPSATLAFMAGILVGRSAAFWWPLLIALGLAGGAFAAGRRFRRMAAVCLAALCIGALAGYRAYHPDLPKEGLYTVTGTVVQEVALRADGQVQTILDDVTVDGRSFPNGAYWTFYLAEDEPLPPDLLPGATVTVVARIYCPGGQANPHGFDFREYLLQRGVTIGLYGDTDLAISQGRVSLTGWMAGIRHDLSEGLLRVMGREHGGYAATMLLGSRDLISEDDRAAFSRLGIAHILSVSGYHVGVLAALLAFLTRPMHLRKPLRIALEGAVLLGYCLLTGGHAPVVRAVLLVLWREFTRMHHRQVLPLHMLCVTACVQLLFRPALLTGASFQLTYCAMLGMLLVAPFLTRQRMCRTHWGQRLWEAFCASLAAQLGILLPQLYWFGELPLLAIVLNMALLAFSSALMTVYWLTLAALPVPILRNILGLAASAMTEGLLQAVRTLARFDFVSLWVKQANGLTAVGWALVLIGLSVLIPAKRRKWRKPAVLIGSLIIVVSLIPLPNIGATYLQFSVGDEDAAILQDDDMTVVIDAGEDGETLAGYLHAERKGIDLLILTHLHSDHAGGVQAILDEGIPVDVCCLPYGAQDAEIDAELLPLLAELANRGTALRTLQRGDRIALPHGSLNVLWPPAGFTAPGQDANHASLVMQADLQGTTMLLTGDLSGVFEHYVQVPSDFLKVAHHGSAQSTSPEFIAAVDPEILLLSNASASRLRRIQELAGGLPLYDTETGGAITIRFSRGGVYEISSWLE